VQKARGRGLIGISGVEAMMEKGRQRFALAAFFWDHWRPLRDANAD